MTLDANENAIGMRMPLPVSRAVLATLLFGFALARAQPGPAEPATEGDAAALQAQVKKTFNDQVTPFLKSYCVSCHGSRPKGGINFLATYKDPGSPAFRQWWKQALANVGAHDMPPDDADKQPTEAERKMFLDWIGQIRFLSPKDPGLFVIRRLSKVEYGNTLHDLFGVDPAIARELPDEVVGQGYLNSLSPLQSEQYLGIANAVVDSVLAPADKPPTAVQKRLFGEPLTPGADARAAARNVARSLARNAYRRPPTEAELDVLL
ncbi:MAG: DUF1587 domain-containing protein, partial [Verrucomicrobiota bacterium]